MKKNITIFCLIASLILIIDTFGMWRIFFEFFFIGIIPGTDNRFDPKLMMMLISIAIGFVIGSVIVLPYARKINSEDNHQLKTIRHTAN